MAAAERGNVHCSDSVAKRNDELASGSFPGAPSTSGAGAPDRRFVMVRFAGLPYAAAVFIVLLGIPTSSLAQEPLAPRGDVVEAERQAPPALSAAPAVAIRSAERRPSALLPLYTSFVTLQVLDIHSTRYALDRGAVEGNPIVRGVTGSTSAMAAVKAAGTAGVIFISEKMRTKNKAAAIGLMIGTNSMMAWVVQHNYRVAR
jgi:hypothetical protein